jgi:hypothetical protein
MAKYVFLSVTSQFVSFFLHVLEAGQFELCLQDKAVTNGRDKNQRLCWKWVGVKIIENVTVKCRCKIYCCFNAPLIL